MSAPVGTANKARTLYSGTLSAAGQKPAFPAAGSAANPQVFAGDFTGAEILGFEFKTGAFATLTTLGIKVQVSNDGITWYDWLTLTAMAQNATQIKMLDDGDDVPAGRFIRLDFSAASGSFGTGVVTYAKVLFRQTGPKGRLAPPGYAAKVD